MEKFNRKLRKTQFQEEEQRKRKNGIAIIIVFLLILAVIVAGVAYFRRQQKKYDHYEVVYNAELPEGTAAYLAYKNGYIRYDRDGAQAYNALGTQLWNLAYNLKNPILNVCDGYTVVADKGSTTFYIVDASGAASRYEALDKIAQARVAAQGVTAVLTTGSEEDHIYLYEPSSSNVLVDIKTQTATNGFPITMALSPDGKKLVTSYMSIETDSWLSWVTFYNFGEVGQNYVDNMVGSYSFEALVPEIRFVSSDTVVVVRDNGFELYQMSETPKVMHTETFNSKIRSTFSDEGYTGFVLEKSEAQTADRLLLYKNSNGRKRLEMSLESEYNDIYTADEEIVLYDSLSCTILRANGDVKFRTTFDKNVNYVFSTDDAEQYLLVGDQTVERIQLKEAEKNASEKNE